MKKNLFLQFFLILWVPVLIWSGFCFYYPWKKINYPMESEPSIPEEYKQILSTLNTYEKLKRLPEIGRVELRTNPFFSPPLLGQGNGTFSGASSFSLTLTSILNLDKRVCLINNKLYREGDRLENNIKILKIGEYYVDLLLPKGKRVRLELGATFIFSS